VFSNSDGGKNFEAQTKRGGAGAPSGGGIMRKDRLSWPAEMERLGAQRGRDCRGKGARKGLMGESKKSRWGKASGKKKKTSGVGQGGGLGVTHVETEDERQNWRLKGVHNSRQLQLRPGNPQGAAITTGWSQPTGTAFIVAKASDLFDRRGRGGGRGDSRLGEPAMGGREMIG